MKELILKFIKSRKFWYGFTTVMLILFSESFGISDTKMNTLVIVTVALIIGQGIADKGCNKC
jgi:ABC-type proline/glycine betaine transport system permease subunit|tara:strand:- start:82 stop:267 length:186 start_codon:yes stop_codon:yes gene_type:complete